MVTDTRPPTGAVVAVVALSVIVAGTVTLATFAVVTSARTRRDIAELRAMLGEPAKATTPAAPRPAAPTDNGRGVLKPEIIIPTDAPSPTE